jgi:MFS superfamily sulfate permease-like transporter
MWIVVGFFIAVIDLNIQPIVEGILIALLTLLPCAILIGWKEPKSLLPILVMTIVLGGLLGWIIPIIAN